MGVPLRDLGAVADGIRLAGPRRLATLRRTCHDWEYMIGVKVRLSLSLVLFLFL
jgi:hypothetical protein